MRKSQDLPAGVDMADPYTGQEGMEDCYGVEYDPRAKECTLCHSVGNCLAQLEQNNKSRKPVPILMKADFNRVRWEEFLGKELSAQELIDAVTEQSQCHEDETIILNIKNFLKANGLRVVNGRVV